MIRGLISGIPFFFSWVFAEVVLDTSINDMYFRGSAEVAGQLTFTVIDRDFSGTSEANPTFFRIGLDKGATLAVTLVDQSLPEDNPLRQPIFLAMKLTVPEGQEDQTSLAAEAHSVSVVRWVEGESVIWVRVQTDSDQWLMIDGLPAGPSDNHRVQFSMGLAAKESANQLANTDPTKRNLPFNTRYLEGLAEPVNDHAAASTSLCLNLGNGTLTSTGVESLVHVDVSYWDKGASLGGGLFSVDNAMALGIQFGVSPIGRGKDRSLTAEPDAPQSAPVNVHRGVRSTSHQLSLEMSSLSDGNNLALTLHNQSYLELILNDAQLGFNPDKLSYVGDCAPGVVVVDDADQMPFGKKPLYSRVRLYWNSGSRDLTRFTMNLFSGVEGSGFEDLDALNVAWSLNLSSDPSLANSFSPWENFPVCPQRIEELASGTWSWPISPYPPRRIPHITRVDGGFVTSIHLTNLSGQTETLSLIGFQENGDQVGEVMHPLQSGVSQVHSVETLMGSNQVSHLEIQASPLVEVTVAYRANRENAGPAHIAANNKQGLQWQIFPGNWQLIYDGLALVNLGQEDTSITITQKDATGAVIKSVVIQENLASNAKRLYLPAVDFVEIQNSSLLIEANQPLAVIALQGDADSTFIWENPSLVLGSK